MRLLLPFVFFICAIAQAATDFFKDPQATAVVDRIGPDLFRRVSSRGLHFGIGVTACDPVTGEQTWDRESIVPCVVILCETEELKAELIGLYGHQSEGVFITYSVTGPVTAAGDDECDESLK